MCDRQEEEKLIQQCLAGKPECAPLYNLLTECLKEHDRDWRKCQKQMQLFSNCFGSQKTRGPVGQTESARRNKDKKGKDPERGKHLFRDKKLPSNMQAAVDRVAKQAVREMEQQGLVPGDPFRLRELDNITLADLYDLAATGPGDSHKSQDIWNFTPEDDD